MNGSYTPIMATTTTTFRVGERIAAQNTPPGVPSWTFGTVTGATTNMPGWFNVDWDNGEHSEEWHADMDRLD